MRSQVSRRHFTLKSLWPAVALGACASSWAQTAAPPAQDTLEEVVITAQRRVESLQNVPIAATVLTGQMLEEKGVQGIVALQYAAPSLTVSDYGSANVLNIRGVGRSAVDVELSSGVVLYRDGVPTFPGYFQNEPYYDLAAIEVLRGPQGTFVGKSAAGGAIFIRTAAPDLTKFSGKVEAEVGNFSQTGATVVFNAPLSDTFGIRIAARHVKRDEAMADSISGPYTGRPGRPDLNSIRFGALWQPNNKLTAQARIDFSNLNFGGNLTSNYGTPLYSYVQDIDFYYRDVSVRGIGDVKYHFDNGLVLSSVTGYQRTHTTNNFDRNGNATHRDRFDSQGEFKLWSEEVNLISPDNSGPFSYVLGAFAQRTDSSIFDWRRGGFNFIGEAGDLGGLVQGSAFPYLGLETPYTKREDETSVFADGKYDLTKQWQLEMGLRYSRYKIDNDTNIVLGDGTSAPFIPFYKALVSLEESDVDGKLSVSYRPNDAQNLYALVSRAHVNAGANIVGGAKFDKELVWDYEAGLKSTWAGGRVRTQVGGYYETFSNYQAQFASPQLSGQNILQNALGTSKVYGFEFSAQARLGQFGFDVAIATLDSKLGTFPNVISPFLAAPNNIITITGGRTPFAPRFSANLGASYEFRLGGGGTLTPRLDISHISDQNASLYTAPQVHLPARTLFNGGLRFARSGWYADLFGTNLTDERYVAGIQNLGTIWYAGALRQYGLRVGKDF